MSRSFHPTTCKDVIRNSALTSRRAETNDSSLILILRNEAGHKLWGRERERQRDRERVESDAYRGPSWRGARRSPPWRPGPAACPASSCAPPCPPPGPAPRIELETNFHEVGSCKITE